MRKGPAAPARRGNIVFDVGADLRAALSFEPELRIYAHITLQLRAARISAPTFGQPAKFPVTIRRQPSFPPCHRAMSPRHRDRHARINLRRPPHPAF
jgi:hypothetical protein